MLRSVLAYTSALMIAASAGAQSFATHQTVINAGVVILDSDSNASQPKPASAAPFAFYNLDNAKSVKPAGWVFQNPLAPNAVTNVIFNRWAGVMGESGTTYVLPSIGDKITKRNAAYWEVFLDNLSDQDIANYNILLINPHVFASLNPMEREHLRRFVDGGGVLWIDPGALSTGTSPVNVIDQTNGFPAEFSISSVVGNTALDADYTQPLLQSPYPLTATDISLLDGGFSTILTVPTPGAEGNAAGNLSGYYGSTLADFFSLQPYSNNGANNNTGMYTRIGDGFVVVTARGASLKLNRPASDTVYTGNGSNTRYYAMDNGGTPVLGPDGLAAAKLAINMISLTAESRQANAGSRKANSIGMDINAPLLGRFDTENLGLTGTVTGQSPISQPTFYKGMMFVTAGGWLYAFDALPSNDLDGDGQSDDGLPDYALGSPYDMVWKAQIGGVLSTPVCGEIADFISPTTRDQVWVTDANGTLYGYNALPTVGGFYSNNTQLTNLPPFVKLIAPTNAANLSPSALPVAPTIHDGVVYVADTQEYNGGYNFRIWMADAHTGSYLTSPATGGKWVIGGSAAGTGAPGDVSGSPVVGQIPTNDNSGGGDKVIYIPVRPNSVGGACGLLSIWVGTRGEAPPQPPVVFPDHLQVTTRAGVQGLPIYTDPTARPEPGTSVTDPRSIRLVVNAPNGTPQTAAWMAQYFASSPSDNGSGTLSFPFATGQSAAFQDLLNAGYSVRVDYTIDWGQNNVTQGDLTSKIVRGGIAFPDVAGEPAKRQIIGNIAMGPQGSLYVVVADPNGANGGDLGGSYYCLQEFGRGSFQITQRYSLYSKYTLTLNQAQPIKNDEVLFDKDPVNQYVETNQDWLSSTDRRMFNFVFTSGPTIRNGQVFVAAQAMKNLNVGTLRIPNQPVTILMAFAANPPLPEIPIGNWTSGSTLSQPDFDQSDPSNLAVPSQTEVLQDNQGPWTYDPNTGYLVFSYLASTGSSANAGGGAGNSNNLTKISTCFSLSQPVTVHIAGGAGDTQLDPSQYGRWSPLLWFQVFEGAHPTVGSSPVVTGDTVFLGMSSVLPSIFNTPGATPSFAGIISGTRAQIPSTDQWLQAADYNDGPNGSYRSWQTQLWTLPSPNELNPTLGGNPNLSNPYLLWPQTSGVQTISQYITRLNETTLGLKSTVTLGLSAGDGTLGAVGDGGIYAFDRADFLVCDEGRLARFDPAGNVIQVNQAFLNAGPGGASNASTPRPLIRPFKAYDLDGNTSLVVDKGANRIIKVDRSGNELRSIDSFQFDPNYGNPSNQPAYSNIWPQEGGFLSESTHLKSPSDVYTYSEYVTPPANNKPQEVTGEGALEYWTHYVIADTGNNRLIELVDRFQADPNTRQVGPPVELTENLVKEDGTLTTGLVAQVGVCLWHSPAAQSGRGFSYNSVNRVWIPPQAAGITTAAIPGRFVYVAGVGNATTVQDEGGTNQTPNTAPGANALGGVVIYDPLAANFAQVYNFMTGFHNLVNLPFWDFTTNQWDTKTPLNVTNLTAPTITNPLGSSASIPFSNVNSVTAKVFGTINQVSGVVASSVIQIMVAGSDGVFEVLYNPNAANLTQIYASGLPINWYLPSQVYRSLRNTGISVDALQQPDANPTELNATYAKRLDNGDVLIVNGYSGTYYPFNSDHFGGEIIEVQGNSEKDPGYGFNLSNPNLGFGLPSIRFQLGPIQGARGLLFPTFADRR